MSDTRPHLYPGELGAWPQGEHPYTHHDPDHWSPWLLFPARWLLLNADSDITLDLWGVWESAPISIVAHRIEAIRPALTPEDLKALWVALGDLYPSSPTLPKVES